MTPAVALQKKIPQEALPKELKDKILNELSSAQFVQRCLRSVEICMNFLKSTGGNGDTQICVYADQVLQMDCSDPQYGLHFPSILNGSDLMLKHVNSLWQSLYTYLNPDPLATLNEKYRITYKQPLTSDIEKFFKALSRDAQVIFISTLERFILDNLGEELIDEGANLKQYMLPMLTHREEFNLSPVPENVSKEFLGNLVHFPLTVFVKYSLCLFDHLSRLTKK